MTILHQQFRQAMIDSYPRAKDEAGDIVRCVTSASCLLPVCARSKSHAGVANARSIKYEIVGEAGIHGRCDRCCLDSCFSLFNWHDGTSNCFIHQCVCCRDGGRFPFGERSER